MIQLPKDLRCQISKLSNKLCNLQKVVEGMLENTPANIVTFDSLDPNLGGTTFTDADGNPGTQLDANTLYVSEIDNSYWTSNGVAYQTYTPPATNTAWYLMNTLIDAAGNKTAAIARLGKESIGLLNWNNPAVIGNFHNPSANDGYIHVSTAGTGTTNSDGLYLGYGLDGNVYFLNMETSAMIWRNGNIQRMKLSALGALTINQAYTLPTADGTANQAMLTNGSGVMSFADVALPAAVTAEITSAIAALLGGVTWKGTYNATTNTPTLANGVGTKGWYYVVAVAGTQNFGAGNIEFALQDWVIYNGTIWEKVDNSEVSAYIQTISGFVSGAGVITNGDTLQTILQKLDGNIGAISFAVPQSNIIYIDSDPSIGIDSTGRGNINNPYLTPEYALADITNTGAVTATTTSGSATLTSVSSTASIIVGQTITGTGIPLNSSVVSKTVNTIVLSNKCTASATVTTTWYTIYEIQLIGNFVWASNWFKLGFNYNGGSAYIYFSGTMFTPTASPLVDFYFINGNLRGNSSSSILFYQAGAGDSQNLTFKPKSFYSIGTDYSLKVSAGQLSCRNLNVDCDSWICAFGKIANIGSSGNIVWNGYRYGLLEGIYVDSYNNNTLSYTSNGVIETPSSINALTLTGQLHNVTENATIYGQAYLYGIYGGVFDGDIKGTAHTVFSYASKSTVFNGNVYGTVAVLIADSVVYMNTVWGNVTNYGAILTVENMAGNYTGSGTSRAVVNNGFEQDNSLFFKNITLTDTAKLTVGNAPIGASYNTYGAMPLINIASGCEMIVSEFFYGNIVTCSGTITVRGKFKHDGKSGLITGLISNENAVIELIRRFTESATDTPTLQISSGTYKQDGGKLFCALADSLSGLIRKTATGGKVQFYGQAYMKVTNGLAPIQILANTGTTQDVEVYSVIDNCAIGFRISDTFTDTTYGTAYAPNILVGGTMLEDTTYLL